MPHENYDHTSDDTYIAFPALPPLPSPELARLRMDSIEARLAAIERQLHVLLTDSQREPELDTAAA